MNFETARAAVDLFVFLASGGKTIEYTFSGGEPLLAWPTIKYCTEYANDRTTTSGMRPSFVLKTNGTLIKPEIISFLREWHIKVVVSIDGLSATHDNHRSTRGREPTHALVLKNMVKLLENDVPCVASITVHPDSCSGLTEGVRYLHSLGITRIDVGPAYGTVSWAGDAIREFTRCLFEIAEYLHQTNREGQTLEISPLNRETDHVDRVLSDCWGCGAGSTNLAFLPGGQITGCSALAMLTKDFPEMLLGDVYDGLNQDAVDRLLQMAQAPICRRSACQTCSAAENCTGGCLAINYATARTPLSPPDIYCSLIKAIPCAWHKAWDKRSAAGNIRESFSDHLGST